MKHEADWQQIGPFRVAIERRGSKLVFGRRRQVQLKLSVRRDGTIAVVAPLTASNRRIVDFVLSSTEWIENQTKIVQELALRHPRPQFVAGERFLFLGTERELVVEPAQFGRMSAEVIESFLVARSRKPGAAAIQAVLRRFYEQQARMHIAERVRFWSEVMQESQLIPSGPSGLSFRCQRTRWGSCSRHRHLSFNWKLICAPEAVIDYVVIHELAHIARANHSPKFWAVVAAVDPNHREHDQWLRAHQRATEFLDP